MPAAAGAGAKIPPFRNRLLHPILAELLLPGDGDGRPHSLRIEELRHSDKFDIVGRPTAVPRSPRDILAQTLRACQSGGSVMVKGRIGQKNVPFLRFLKVLVSGLPFRPRPPHNLTRKTCLPIYLPPNPWAGSTGGRFLGSRPHFRFRSRPFVFEEELFVMSRRCELTGKAVQSGNKVSHSNRKTRTRFLPNLVHVTLLSETLGRAVRLRVSAAALRSVEHRGGLDRVSRQSEHHGTF